MRKERIEKQRKEEISGLEDRQMKEVRNKWMRRWTGRRKEEISEWENGKVK